MPDIIRSFASGTTASLAAQHGTRKFSQPFRKLQGSNLEFRIFGFLDYFGNILVPFLAPREAAAPLAKDLIISGTLIWSFRHLKHQNLSAGDDFIYGIRTFF